MIRLFVLLFLAFSNIVLAQVYPKDYFGPPLDIPLILSGTFGELRSNHFHAGIDIKTKGTSGLKVYSVAEGYVSRIKVSPWGYGKAIYVTHPNGFTSVYAHLMRYEGKIETYVKNEQYNKKSYAIELYPAKDELVVTKGQIIALSGNTGGSMAPHLHFEIRNTANEKPLNVLKFGFDIVDDLPPIVRSLKIYQDKEPWSNTFSPKSDNYKVIGSDGLYNIEESIDACGPFGIGLHTHDVLNGANNKNGVYSIDIEVDTKLVYSHQLDDFHFHETKFINSHIDFHEKQDSKKMFHKCFIEPNNKLSIYNEIDNDGIIDFKSDSILPISIKIKDVYGNQSSLSFNVKSKDCDNDSVTEKFNDVLFLYTKENIFDNNEVKLKVPPFSLYKNILFEYQSKQHFNHKFLSNIYSIHNKYTPLHKGAQLSIKANIDTNFIKKSFIAKLNENQSLNYIGGKYNNNFFTTKIKHFGDYVIALDTIKPSIKGLNIYPGKKMKNSTLKVQIKDDLSGIKSYRGEIDGQWILLEYEPKQNRLTHYFLNSLTKGKHVFTLEVTDNKDNVQRYEALFYR